MKLWNILYPFSIKRELEVFTMIDNKKIDEITIADIILCEPITGKGRESLTRLGLTY